MKCKLPHLVAILWRQYKRLFPVRSFDTQCVDNEIGLGKIIGRFERVTSYECLIYYLLFLQTAGMFILASGINKSRVFIYAINRYAT